MRLIKIIKIGHTDIYINGCKNTIYTSCEPADLRCLGYNIQNNVIKFNQN